MSAINKSVVEGSPEEVLSALKAPVAGIRSITDECADTYQEKLRTARAEKGEKCKCSHQCMYQPAYVYHLCVCVLMR